MSESPPSPADRPATPRWVKGLAVAFVLAILVVVIVMVASGGQHGPGMHTEAGGPTAPPNSPAAGGAGGPASSAEASRTIEVTTRDSMAFEPAIQVSAGEVVTFVVTNAGEAVHEFTLGDVAMQREHADAMAHMPPDMHHDFPNSITVQPGHTDRLTWRFGAAGTLEFACHEPGHYDAGMRGEITVS